MIMRARVGDGEADRHHVEERRVGERGAAAHEIVARMKDEFEAADARFGRRDQRRVLRPSALVVALLTRVRASAAPSSVELDPNARSGRTRAMSRTWVVDPAKRGS